MTFTEYCRLYPLSIEGSSIITAVRPKTIWFLRSDSAIYVFNRDTMSVLTSFSFTSSQYKEAKMFVDDDGEKCFLMFPSHILIYMSLSNNEMTSISLPKGIIANTGCWIKQSNSLPLFLIGTKQGEVILVNPGSNRKPCFLYKTSGSAQIEEIICISDNFCLIFLLVQEKLLCFFGYDQIEVIFSQGPAKQIVFLGSLQKTVFPRIKPDYSAGKNSIAAIVPYGVLLISAIETGHNSLHFKQSIVDADVSNVLSFERCDLGTLISSETGVTFLSNSALRLNLPLPDIYSLYSDNKQVLLFTQCEIISFPYSDFKKMLCSEAISHGDPKFAIEMAGSISDPWFLASLSKLSFNEITSFFSLLEQRFSDVIKTFSVYPILLNAYLMAMLRKLSKRNVRAMTSISLYIFHTFVALYPNFEIEFLDFINLYGSILPKDSSYFYLNSIGFTSGLISMAKIRKDDNCLINEYISKSDYGSLFEVLNRQIDPKIVINVISRVKHTEQMKVFISKNLKFDPLSIVPVLANNIDISSSLIHASSYHPILILIRIVSFAKQKSIDELNNIVSMYNPNFIFREAQYNNLLPVAVQIAIDQQRYYLAVKLSMNEGYGFIKNCIDRHPKKAGKKALYKAAHALSNPEIRPRILKDIVASTLFSFEEIICMLNPDDQLFTYSQQIINTVASMNKLVETPQTKEKSYKTHRPDLIIKKDQICEICHTPIISTCFARFPCGHFFHYDCLKSNIASLEINMNPEDSCPICGFISTLFVAQSI